MSYSTPAPPQYTPYEEIYSDDEAPPPRYEYTFEKPKIPVESEKFEESFPIERPKYQDKTFTLIFFATIVGLIVLDVFSFNSLIGNKHVLIQESLNLDATDDWFSILSPNKPVNGRGSIIRLIMFCILIPISSSLFMLFLAWWIPMFFVFVGYLLVPLSLFGIAFVSLISGMIFPALLYGFFGFLSVLFLFQNYSKLSFTSLMLKVVIEVMSAYPSTMLVSFLSSIFSGFIGVLYFIAVSVITADRLKKDDADCPHSSDGEDLCVSNTSFAISIFVLFAGYYIFEVLSNLTHVIISGVFGSWYFFHKSQVKPRYPAWYSFKRAITYSFGSICFGSLIVSAVKTLRAVLTMAKAKLNQRRFRDREEGNGGNDMIFCMLICIVSIMEWLASEAEYWIKWFNKFAYSYLALYGKDYLSSARDTFEILKYKGILILITDSLINTTLTFYAILIAVFSSGLFFLLYMTTSVFENLAPEFVGVGFVLQLLLSYFITKITLNSLNSGFITFMIALSIKPEVFERNYHEYFVKMTNYYPEISHTLKTPF
ncbi:hypothetical protein CANARDRAFT_10283 [[Candida] arabinofermentans NRRL YB-2248]|uniref:Protein PNS1 n=1 Tax=[Candida] arabinofermentans NRRL YB-2248 TaxID=983967 RepID=A0A1E4STB3_9ASCO|nr:hypothetical protein CANARDRAFT_10283 [[Candida] arabinofermentans NRRL YB-2248]